MEQRQKLLEKQVDELQKMKQQQHDQEREIGAVKKQIGDLKIQHQRYDTDIARLRDVLERLTDHVNELKTLIQNRREELQEAEQNVIKCDKQITHLSKMLKTKVIADP